jgi:hypothetical protein
MEKIRELRGKLNTFTRVQVTGPDGVTHDLPIEGIMINIIGQGEEQGIGMVLAQMRPQDVPEMVGATIEAAFQCAHTLLKNGKFLDSLATVISIKQAINIALRKAADMNEPREGEFISSTIIERERF